MNIEETLEELQDNKLATVCEKINLQTGDRLLDIGCGWGSLVTFASVNYDAFATGLTIDPYQADLGNWRLQCAEISETQSRICNRAYEGPDEKYDKIVCLQSSGQEDLKVAGFFERCYEMLADDGVFHVEITASRRAWQYEDLVWGLFLKRHVIPWMTMGWDLGKYVTSLEEAGFEIQRYDFLISSCSFGQKVCLHTTASTTSGSIIQPPYGGGTRIGRAIVTRSQPSTVKSHTG